jgi:hypothetical protein
LLKKKLEFFFNRETRISGIWNLPLPSTCKEEKLYLPHREKAKGRKVDIKAVSADMGLKVETIPVS